MRWVITDANAGEGVTDEFLADINNIDKDSENQITVYCQGGWYVTFTKSDIEYMYRVMQGAKT